MIIWPAPAPSPPVLRSLGRALRPDALAQNAELWALAKGLQWRTALHRWRHPVGPWDGAMDGFYSDLMGY